MLPTSLRVEADLGRATFGLNRSRLVYGQLQFLQDGAANDVVWVLKMFDPLCYANGHWFVEGRLL